MCRTWSKGSSACSYTDFSEPVNLGNPNEITVMQLAEEIIGLVEGTKSTIIHEDLPQDDPKGASRISREPDLAGLGAGCRSRGRAETGAGVFRAVI